MSLIHMLLIVCPLIFLASFVDSIAGGGGLISLPAYMLTGLPMHVVCGCNKVSAGIGTLFSAYRFYSGGKMRLKSALASGVLALFGASVGAALNMRIDSDLLKKVFLVLLPVVAVIVMFGQLGRFRTRTKPPEGVRLGFVCALIGFVVGMYDGLIGPGTGTFLIFGFTTFAGFDYVTASGNAKVANLASNVASALIYIAAGQVVYALALPAAVFSILGGWLGSSLAIQKGARFVRVIMLLVLAGIFVKLLIDMAGLQ